MKYRELTDHIKKTLGAIDYGLIGRFSKIYKIEFIYRCVNLYPDFKKNLSPKQKAIYFGGILRKEADDSSYINKNPITYDI